MLNFEKIAVTADTAGAGTTTGKKNFMGKLYGVKWLLGTASSGAVDVTVEVVNSDGASTLVTITNAAGNAFYYPRHLVHSEAAAALTGTAGGDRAQPLVVGNVKVTVAQAGSGGACAVVVFVDEG